MRRGPSSPQGRLNEEQGPEVENACAATTLESPRTAANFLTSTTTRRPDGDTARWQTVCVCKDPVGARERIRGIRRPLSDAANQRLIHSSISLYVVKPSNSLAPGWYEPSSTEKHRLVDRRFEHMTFDLREPRSGTPSFILLPQHGQDQPQSSTSVQRLLSLSPTLDCNGFPSMSAT